MLEAIKAQQENPKDDRPIHFHVSSGGNAGLACATAAVTLGFKCTVALAASTEKSMVAKLRAAGAFEVVVHGENWFVADANLRELVMPEAERRGEKAVYIPPFDHPDVWAGHATMISEIARQMPQGLRPDAIVCSVGGGGLFSGICQGVESQQWSPETQVIAVETVGADSLAQAVEKKELVKLKAITSVATSLGAPVVAQRALDYALQDWVSNLVVEDAEACASCWRFADDERLLVEPACGAAVALAYDGRLKKYLKGFSEKSKVVLVVCGGSRIDLSMMDAYKQRFGNRAQELGLTRCEDVPSTHTTAT